MFMNLNLDAIEKIGQHLLDDNKSYPVVVDK